MSNYDASLLATSQAQLNNAINMVYTSDISKQARKYYTSERIAQQEWNEKMWNMTNEYNSISSQLERAEKAGISPNAIIGGMNTTATNPTMNGVSPIQGHPLNFESISAPMMNIDSLKMQARQMDINEKVANSNIRNTNSLSALNEQQFAWNDMTESTRMALLDSNLQNNYASTKNLLADVGYKDVSAQQIKQMLPFIATKSKAEIDLMLQQTNNLRTENIKTIEEINNLRKTGKKIDSETLNIEADTALVGAQKTLAQDEHDLNKFDLQQNELKKEFCKLTGLPYGTNESDMYYALWLTGELEPFINDLSIAKNPYAFGGLQDARRQFSSVYSSYRNPMYFDGRNAEDGLFGTSKEHKSRIKTKQDRLSNYRKRSAEILK